MRAIIVPAYGGPNVLRVEQIPKPETKSGEVLLKIYAAGVSHADVMQRAGNYPPPPGASDVLGLEAAGIIEESGERVCALLSGGGYAEYAAVPREQILPLPAGWDFVEAATLPENMFTVYDNLITRARFQKGERILVHGGTSGIGSTAIMLARASGASFIAATAGSERKCAACVEIGADLAIDYRREDFVQAIARATDGGGVDVIIDVVGGDYVARDIEALALGGRIVCLAMARGPGVQFHLGKLIAKRGAIIASSLRSRTVREKGAIARALLENVWPLLPAKNPIRPIVDSVFTLEEATAAHERLERSDHIGKIVLVVDPGTVVEAGRHEEQHRN